MNVAKYITNDRIQTPAIHEGYFDKIYNYAKAFPLKKADRMPYATEKTHSQPFPLHKGERVNLNDFPYKNEKFAEKKTDVWAVFGISPKSLTNLPLENKLRYNPDNLNDKEIAHARMQQNAGVANKFTQRLENMIDDRPLTDIKEDERQLKTNLRSLDEEYHSSLAKLKEGLKLRYDKNKSRRNSQQHTTKPQRGRVLKSANRRLP